MIIRTILVMGLVFTAIWFLMRKLDALKAPPLSQKEFNIKWYKAVYRAWKIDQTFDAYNPPSFPQPKFEEFERQVNSGSYPRWWNKHKPTRKHSRISHKKHKLKHRSH